MFIIINVIIIFIAIINYGTFFLQCKSIVDEYYPEIYTYLVKGLNSNIVCEMGGICPLPGKEVDVST